MRSASAGRRRTSWSPSLGRTSAYFGWGGGGGWGESLCQLAGLPTMQRDCLQFTQRPQVPPSWFTPETPAALKEEFLLLPSPSLQLANTGPNPWLLTLIAYIHGSFDTVSSAVTSSLKSSVPVRQAFFSNSFPLRL